MKPCARVTKLKNGCDEMTRSAKRSSQLSYPVPVATGTGLEPATSPLSVDETLSARNQDCRKKTAMQRSRRVIFRRPTIRRLAGVEPDLRIGLMKPCPRAVRFFRSPPRSHRYVRQFWWLGPGRGAVRWWTCRYRNRVQPRSASESFTRVGTIVFFPHKLVRLAREEKQPNLSLRKGGRASLLPYPPVQLTHVLASALEEPEIGRAHV